MLHGQCLRSLARSLFQCLMADTVLYIIGMATVGMCHPQRFGEDFLLTISVRTYHVAGLQYQRGVVTKPFRTLNLTITVAVYR